MAQNNENEFEKTSENILNDEFESEDISVENDNSDVPEEDEVTSKKVNLEKNVIETYEDDTEEEDEKYVSQFGELEDFVEGYQSEDFNSGSIESVMPPKKKMSQKTLVTIIVTVAVIVVALAVGAYFVFFNNSVKGTWIYTDENTSTSSYYVFTGNQMQIIAGDDYMSQKNTYSNVKYEGNTISIMSGENIGAQYTYTITGNLIQGKTLTLSMDGYTVAELTNAWKIELPEELKGPDFEKNDDIVGVWKNADVTGYVDYMSFSDDGLMIQVMGDNSSIQEVTQKYNFDGEAINLKYDDTDYPVTARIEDGKLIVTSSKLDTSTFTYQEVEIVYEKVTQEEFDETKKSLLAGTCEIPTSAPTSASSTEQSATEATTEETSEQSSTEATAEETSEQTTETATELVTEAVTTAE